MDGEAEARAAAVLEAERELALPSMMADVVAFLRGAGMSVPVAGILVLKRQLRSHMTEFAARMLDAGGRLAHERDTLRASMPRAPRAENPGPWSEDSKTPVRRRIKKVPRQSRVGRSGSSRPRGPRRQ